MKSSGTCRACGCDLASMAIACPLCSTVSKRRLVTYFAIALGAICLGTLLFLELNKEPASKGSIQSAAIQAREVAGDLKPQEISAEAAAIEAQLKAERLRPGTEANRPKPAPTP